ncbi:helix-turn-helix transcriptional regulator [Isoptericola sp. NPDC019482]|uniref:helix-turn-helix domain-containing protein n=1 Tax=Isoptericola sp. NPDC019482 TaxID=3154688 RepID=UPI00347EF49B
MEQAREKEIPRHRKVLGTYVSDARKSKGMTQAELAQHLADYGMKTHPTSIAKIEAGTRGVTVDELVSIGDALGWEPYILENLLVSHSPADQTAMTAGDALTGVWLKLTQDIGQLEKARRLVVTALESEDVSAGVRERLQGTLESSTLQWAIDAADITERGVEAYLNDFDQEAP